MAASSDVSTGVLGVGGGPYALLLPRSSDFAELFDILKIRYPRSIDRMSILALMQSLWDRMCVMRNTHACRAQSTPHN